MITTRDIWNMRCQLRKHGLDYLEEAKRLYDEGTRLFDKYEDYQKELKTLRETIQNYEFSSREYISDDVYLKKLKEREHYLEINKSVSKYRSNRYKLKSLNKFKKGSDLIAKANTMWGDFVLQNYAGTKLKWKFVKEKKDYLCTLTNGETFEPN